MCVCLCVLILILTNKAACFIYHNQQHSHSVTAIFHFSRLKWCVRRLARACVCVFFGSFQSTISRVFFGIWSVFLFVSSDHLSLTYCLCLFGWLVGCSNTSTHWFDPMCRLGKQEKLLDFHCMQHWLSLCARVRVSGIIVIIITIIILMLSFYFTLNKP